MQRYFLSLFPLQLLLYISLTLVISADEIKTTIPKNIHEARSQYGRVINEAIKSRDLEKCKSAFDSLIETFHDDDPNTYVRFMSATCTSISEGLDNDFIRLFEEQALKVLQKENLDTAPLTYQWDLLCTVFRRKLERLLQESTEDKSKTELFIKQRKWHVEQFAHVWKKIENMIDPAFDIKDHKELFRPLYEISPAYSIGGMDPNCIADEAERKKLLDYIDKRDKILRKNTNQKKAIFFLNNEKEEFINRVVKYYAVKPYNIDEVQSILTDAKIDKNITQEIIKKLKITENERK